jgi:membrane protease YdiL (CAAX protease family)
MKSPDVLYLALFGTWLVFEPFVVWPAFVRRLRADAVRARAFLWSSWIALLWLLTAAGVALWVFEARSWEALRVAAPHGWRLWVATGLVAALAISYARRGSRIARSQRRRRVKIGNPGVERLAPHTWSELRLWLALSITAGCCEEFLFRGYLIWAFQPLLGLWGAAALSLVVFAAAHAYQGAKGMVAVGALGAVFTVVVLTFGSLWPAIVMHAIVDAGEGLVAWLVLRKRQCLVMAESTEDGTERAQGIIAAG